MYFQKRAPVYAFGEEAVYGAANIILVGANRCFAAKHSTIGQFGFSDILYDKSEFNKEYGIKTNHFSEATKGSKLDSNTPFTSDDKKWNIYQFLPNFLNRIQNVLVEREEELKKEIIKLRAEKFHEKGVSNDILNQKVFHPNLIFGEEAAKYGLIDKVSTFDEIVNTEFPDAKIKLVLNRRPQGFAGQAQFSAGIFDLISPVALQMKISQI